MSGTYVESVPHAGSVEPAPSRSRLWSRWPARVLVLLIALWVLAEGVSLAIDHTRLRNLLTAQIAAAMGRPVEVRSYAFSFWGGPVVEARSVTVAEDPRFGAEYFLRADSMAVRLSWRSLLRGRIEFGTLSLNRPSLNLVRNSVGDWNLAEWLPHPGALPAPRTYPGPVLPSTATRFRRIEVEGGRINFKLEDEKLPFAFVGVAGTVETDRPGRWRINLQATPWRAAALMQRAGTLHLSGDVGGTSSRLRPAAFNISWTDASLSDVLRLARNDDLGIRGALALSIDVRTDDASADGWTTNARFELSQLHRWNLAQRPDNPSLNLIAQLAWTPSASVVTLTHAKIEAPHSTLDADGGFSWGRESGRTRRTVSPPNAVFSTAQIDASDLMAWFRAFHTGVADGVSMRGVAQVSAAFAAWPPRIVNASISSEGLELAGATPRESAHLGRVLFRYKNGSASMLPVNLTWGPSSAPSGSFRLEAVTKQSANAVPAWHFAGSASQVRDVLAGTSDFGWNISRSWNIAGPTACDLHWQSAFAAGFVASMVRPDGWIELGSPKKSADGASLRAAFLNLPIEQVNARIELKSGARQIKLASAEAFGARWNGTLDRRDPAEPWHFTLSADRLSSTDLDRWLNPHWRESFLDRMLPFLNSRSPAAAGPENLHAVGRLAIDRFNLAPFTVSHLQGSLEIAGRHVTFKDGTGQLAGGRLSGSLDANLLAVPSYHADLDFTRVDVAALLADLPSLHGFSAGSGSGGISFGARGAVRSDLINSLSCQGVARLADLKLQNVHESGADAESSAVATTQRYSTATAEFSCGQRKIEFRNLALQSPERSLIGSGTVDLSGALDLRFKPASATRPSPNAASAFRLTGTLAAPQLVPVSAASSRRNR